MFSDIGGDDEDIRCLWRISDMVLNARAFLPAKKMFFLPLAGFNRFKPAKSGRKWQKMKMTRWLTLHAS